MSATRPHSSLRALAARPKRLIPVGAALMALAAPSSAAALPVDAQVTVNGVNVVNALVYKFRTEYPKPGGGTIVRQTPAVLNVPTPLDIDQDLLPDATGTVKATSLDHFVLQVDRFVGESSDLGAQVELIVKDPTGALPREKVSLGYDARGSRAPQTWTGTIDLLENTEDTTRLGLNFAKTGETPKLALIGGMHDGDDAARKSPIAAHLQFAPVPASVGAELSIGDGHYDVHLTKSPTATPTKLTGKVKYLDGATHIDATTDIDGVPGWLDVSYDETGDATADVVYEASERVTKADVTFVQHWLASIDTAAEAHLSDVPNKVTVNQTSESAGRITAHGDTLGRAEVGFGSKRKPVLPASDDPYLAFETDGTFKEMGDRFSLAARVDRLKEVTFDGGTPMALDATFAPFPGMPMDLVATAKDSRWQLNGRIDDMPKRITLGIDTASGHIAYNGHGQAIDRITFDGVADPAHPFIEKGSYDHIHAMVTGLPPEVTVDIAPQGDSVDIVAKPEPVAQVEADLYRGPQGCLSHLEPTRSGGAYVDTAEESCAGGRIEGVKEVHIRPEPLKVAYLGDVEQAVDVYAKFDDPDDPNAAAALIEGTVDAVPAEFSMELAPSNLDSTPVDKLTYRAKERIEKIDMTMRNLPGKFSHGDIHLEDLPRHLDMFVPLGTAKTRMVVDTFAQGIGKMTLDLRDTPQMHALPEDADTVYVNGRDGHMQVAMRVHDVRDVELHTPLRADALAEGSFKAVVNHTQAPKPLDVQIKTDKMRAEVTVPKPPMDMSIERAVPYLADGTPQPEKIVWRSSGITDSVTLGLRTDDLAMRGTLTDLPKDFDFCTWSGYGGLNSGPGDVDPSWCYQPAKAPLGQGGDPFNVYDNVQFTLDSIGDMEKPMGIDNLVLCPDPSAAAEGWALCEALQEANWTRILDLKTGEVTAALGSGVIFGCNQDPVQMAALYGDLFDSEECDDQEENTGLHLFLDTDKFGLTLGLLQMFDTPELPEDPTDTSMITVKKIGGPITADHGLRVADMDGIPGLTYKGGTLNCGTGFAIGIQLATFLGNVDVGLPADGTLQDFLEC